MSRKARLAEKGKAHVLICRSNLCGKYDDKHKACSLIRRVGVKGLQDRPGRVAWLLHNPNVPCPNDPPMW